MRDAGSDRTCVAGPDQVFRRHHAQFGSEKRDCSELTTTSRHSPPAQASLRKAARSAGPLSRAAGKVDFPPMSPVAFLAAVEAIPPEHNPIIGDKSRYVFSSAV